MRPLLVRPPRRSPRRPPSGPRVPRGHTLIEPMVALMLLAVGALGAAALLAHAAQRLNRSAQLARMRDAAATRTQHAALVPCEPAHRGVTVTATAWTDSSTGNAYVRGGGTPCVE